MSRIAIVLLFSAAASSTRATTPVDKVVSLLTKLSAQVQAEGAEEAASYDKYACFCKDQADDKTYVIAKSDKEIEELSAAVKALSGEITQLDTAVADRKKDVKEEEIAQTEKQETRSKDQESYTSKRKDLAEAVDAVDRALTAMKDSHKDVEGQLSSLLQKLPSTSPALAFIASAVAGAKPGEATAYKYSSKEVIATLQSLMMSFKKELADLDKAEISAVGEYEMSAGARANTIKAYKKEIMEKETLSASKGEEKSEKEELINQETTSRNADQEFLDDLTLKCEEKAKAWDKRSTTRASELTALSQAVEVLKGMGGLYASNSKLVGLVSTGSKPSIGRHVQGALLEIQSASRWHLDQKKLDQLVSQLTQQAHLISSPPLAMIAVQLRSVGPDHFVKVRGLVKDLIKKLEADAAAEATSKSFCDKAMTAGVEKRDKNAAALETASAQIDSTAATISGLKKEVSDLSEEIANLNKMLLEAAELRAREKAQNEKTIANANSGKVAVDQAVELLKKFYAASLLQDPKPKKQVKDREGNTLSDVAPKTFSSSEEYKGKADASKGVIGMLEVISSDFERTSKTVADAEKQSEKDYNTLKTDTEKDLTDKAKLKKTKETEVETKDSELTGFKGDLKDATEMNEQAIEELEKLKASCVDTGETYEERAQHRKEEIEALKQALQVLEEWK